MYRGRGTRVGAPGGCGLTAASCSGMVALDGALFSLGKVAASENILLRQDSFGKERFLEVVWHLDFQCCSEVLCCGNDCVTWGDGWVGDVLVIVKHGRGYPDCPCVDNPHFPPAVVLE